MCKAAQTAPLCEPTDPLLGARSHAAAIPSLLLTGYHVTFAPRTDTLLARAVTDPSSGWIATPMGGGLRVAGKVELGGVDAPPSPARWAQIEAETHRLLDVDLLGPRDASKDWMGFRPTV